ncbi:hypothetical protein Scep_009234 [Stephania cephalantha]|uniref:Uncharacterized protein n=1 Tax=Stephania cephalantha TaxID=152367 RepID=A0AAP0PCC9_9MAGN
MKSREFMPNLLTYRAHLLSGSYTQFASSHLLLCIYFPSIFTFLLQFLHIRPRNSPDPTLHSSFTTCSTIQIPQQLVRVHQIRSKARRRR